MDFQISKLVTRRLPAKRAATNIRVAIMGVRGVPAAHGGFETFAARLAPYLASNGWAVNVYCQEDRPPQGSDKPVWHSTWHGVKRTHIAVGADTAFNSIVFDWRCVAHAVVDRPDVVLILGYNTALFAARLRLAGLRTVFNMDGIEWSRQKWNALAKAWLYVNERAGCLFGNHLIADHPHIEQHLLTRTHAKKISVIPYGSDPVDPQADVEILGQHGLTSGGFATLIARPEPENSILEMVRAFSARPRGIKLVVLGNYLPETNSYHAQVRAAAGDEVVFAGAIYTQSVVEALRHHSLFYLHGHQAGGCNPSLLEAMGAGNAVVAHDNRFNRWVVGDGAWYFADENDCKAAIDQAMWNSDNMLRRGAMNRRRAAEVFHWSSILQSYAEVLHDVVHAAPKRHTLPGWGRRELWQIDAPLADNPQLSDP